MSKYRKGDKVMVLKGAPVRNLGPAGNRTQGRNMTVTIDHIRLYATPTPEIVWAGSGGYWTSTTVDWVRPPARKEEP